MEIDIPDHLVKALNQKANEEAVSPATYLTQLLQRELGSLLESAPSNRPFKTSYGILAKYGPAPSEEDIAQNRAEMFANFGEGF